ncbi:MAG: hypothetical protein OET90_01845 [Desulfuromonadales bacterium]|nr:hypothetical protein [Desulfuromonadales bacterium]
MKHLLCTVLVLFVLLCLAVSFTSPPEQLVRANTFSEPMICKAGISATMSHDPTILKAEQGQADIDYLLFYTHLPDQPKHGYRCKVEDDNIIWGAINGRWRTGIKDAKLSYATEGDAITVTKTYPNGEVRTKSFTLAQMQGN